MYPRRVQPLAVCAVRAFTVSQVTSSKILAFTTRPGPFCSSHAPWTADQGVPAVCEPYRPVRHPVLGVPALPLLLEKGTQNISTPQSPCFVGIPLATWMASGELSISSWSAQVRALCAVVAQSMPPDTAGGPLVARALPFYEHRRELSESMGVMLTRATSGEGESDYLQQYVITRHTRLRARRQYMSCMPYLSLRDELRELRAGLAPFLRDWVLLLTEHFPQGAFVALVKSLPRPGAAWTERQLALRGAQLEVAEAAEEEEEEASSQEAALALKKKAQEAAAEEQDLTGGTSPKLAASQRIALMLDRHAAAALRRGDMAHVEAHVVRPVISVLLSLLHSIKHAQRPEAATRSAPAALAAAQALAALATHAVIATVMLEAAAVDLMVLSHGGGIAMAGMEAVRIQAAAGEALRVMAEHADPDLYVACLLAALRGGEHLSIRAFLESAEAEEADAIHELTKEDIQGIMHTTALEYRLRAARDAAISVTGERDSDELAGPIAVLAALNLLASLAARTDAASLAEALRQGLLPQLAELLAQRGAPTEQLVDVLGMLQALLRFDWAAGTNAAVMARFSNRQGGGDPCGGFPPAEFAAGVARAVDSNLTIRAMLKRLAGDLDASVRDQALAAEAALAAALGLAVEAGLLTARSSASASEGADAAAAKRLGSGLRRATAEGAASRGALVLAAGPAWLAGTGVQPPLPAAEPASRYDPRDHAALVPLAAQSPAAPVLRAPPPAVGMLGRASRRGREAAGGAVPAVPQQLRVLHGRDIEEAEQREARRVAKAQHEAAEALVRDVARQQLEQRRRARAGQAAADATPAPERRPGDADSALDWAPTSPLRTRQNDPNPPAAVAPSDAAAKRQQQLRKQQNNARAFAAWSMYPDSNRL